MEDLVARPTRAIVQASYIKPFCDGNYGQAIEEPSYGQTCAAYLEKLKRELCG